MSETNAESRGRARARAHSIVFRDDSVKSESSRGSNSSSIAEEILRLPRLRWEPTDNFEMLCDVITDSASSGSSASSTSLEEESILALLKSQGAVVKTMRNTEVCWSGIVSKLGGDEAFPTSTTLLPPGCVAMRTFGSESEFPVGLIWALPDDLEGEGERLNPRKPRISMAWPSGYAAKTEFNMDNLGNLSNGREENLVSIEELREQNRRFAEVAKDKSIDFEIMGRVLSGTTSVPYNELIVNVGGRPTPNVKSSPSLLTGLGRPCALFCRNCTFISLCSLLRANMRLTKIYPDTKFPLFVINPLFGAHCINAPLQLNLYKHLSCFVNPFRSRHVLEDCMLSLDESVKKSLTTQECAALAGGFGVSDDDVAALFLVSLDGSADDKEAFEMSRKVAFNGLVHSIRAGDSRTAKQLVELYTICGTKGSEDNALPPPLDTSVLRQTTKDHSLLIVLGAAEIVRALQSGQASERLVEAADALQEWCKVGHTKGIKFRLSSWRQQNKAIKSDDELNVSSRMTAFLGEEAIEKRAKFAVQLRQSADCNTVKETLEHLNTLVLRMSKPALRLELLQFALGLESRYTLGMVKDSIVLARGFVTTAKNIVK